MKSFSEREWIVRTLDLRGANLLSSTVAVENRFTGSVADRELVDRATAGAEYVIHLAWSFSDRPGEIFQTDIPGHLYLLEAAVRNRVRRFIYTSTATVYGRAVRVPVTEDHPRLIFEARKPLYALSKGLAEDLCLYYHKTAGLPTVVFRFWWAFGDTIGGRHLRDMVWDALRGKTLEVPAGVGGTFVTMQDLAKAFELALTAEQAAGKVYNIGSFYVTWEEIAGMIAEATGSSGGVKAVSPEEWAGPKFLSDSWEIGWERAAEELGFRPALGREEGIASLKKAITAMAEDLKGNSRAE